MNGASPTKPPFPSGCRTRKTTSFHSPFFSVPTGTLWRKTSRPDPAPTFTPLTKSSCAPSRSRKCTPTDSSNRLRSCLVKNESSTLTQVRSQKSDATGGRAADDGIGARDCAEAHATASAAKHQNKHRRRGMGLRMRQAKPALVAIFGAPRAQIIVISSDMTEVPHDRRAL